VGFLASASRNAFEPAHLEAAASFVEAQLAEAGLAVARERYTAGGRALVNVVATRPGRSADLVVLGAHYDSVRDCPGANDNGSGVAVLLALGRALASEELDRTMRFVAFANEEPPFFQTDGMGSFVHAKGCRDRGENVVAMLSLETMGYYRDEDGSQAYPPPFAWLYPSTGNFIAFVGHRASSELVRDAIGTFRTSASFPSEGAAPPAFIQGVDWSDHWSFWQHGYPNAIMVTDTAPFRYPHYHRPTDTADRLDYERLSRVVGGLVAVVRHVAAE
jgi:Zn-dependent M28 family amino/carboxypeptidase